LETHHASWGAVELVGHSIERLGSAPEREIVAGPGEALKVSLYWRKATASEGDPLMALELVDWRGRALWRGAMSLSDEAYPWGAWPVGAVVRRIAQIGLPSDAQPGAYRLRVRPAERPEERPYVVTRLRVRR
jgi:hypothetical protein